MFAKPSASIIRSRIIAPGLAVACFMVTGLTVSSPALAQGPAAGSDNIFKAGVVHFALNDSSSDLQGPQTPPGVQVEVDSPTAVAFSYTRLIGDHFGMELLFGVPFGIDIQAAGTLAGAGQVAEATIATASLTGSYYFTPKGSKVRPYIGLGYNYSTFYDVEATPVLEGALSGQTDISMEDSTGPGIYAGVNYALNDKWLVSGIIGYNEASTDATLRTDTVIDMGAGPVNVGEIEREIAVDLNPVLVFATIGYRF